jgi:hypothetical protein
MLLLVNLREETEMYDQLVLFEEPPPAWVSRLWKTMDSAKRQEIVEIMAEMGTSSIAKTILERKEAPDESRRHHV